MRERDVSYELDQYQTVALQLLRADSDDAAECRQSVRPLACDFSQRLVVQDYEGWYGLHSRFSKAPVLEAFEQGGVLRTDPVVSKIANDGRP